jgi:hypothetical protein
MANYGRNGKLRSLFDGNSSTQATLKRRKNVVEADKVAGLIQVSREEPEEGIFILFDLENPKASKARRVTLSPRQARHLANVLMMYAEEAEGAADRRAEEISGRQARTTKWKTSSVCAEIPAAAEEQGGR